MLARARVCRWLHAMGVAAALVISLPEGAWAQDEVTQTPNPVAADLKGMIGLGLIGAELGFVVPALAGARDPWMYVVFPLIGAGGGAVGGYYLLERGAGEPELAVASLTLGMALVVPTLVITMAATAYDPERDAARGLPARMHAAREAGPGLVRVSERGWGLSAPAIETGYNVSVAEARQTGVQRRAELRVPVVSGRF